MSEKDKILSVLAKLDTSFSNSVLWSSVLSVLQLMLWLAFVSNLLSLTVSISQLVLRLIFMLVSLLQKLTAYIFQKFNTNSQQGENEQQIQDCLVHAVKLPSIVSKFNEEQKADLTDLRTLWYGKRKINRWVHFDVFLNTLVHVLINHYYFLLLQKIADRLQPMEKTRLPKIEK